MRSMIWFFAALFIVLGLFRCSLGNKSAVESEQNQSQRSNENSSEVSDQNQGVTAVNSHLTRAEEGHTWRTLSINEHAREVHPDMKVRAEYQGLKSCDKPGRLLCAYTAHEGKFGHIPGLARSDVVTPRDLLTVRHANDVCRASVGEGWHVAYGKPNELLLGFGPRVTSTEVELGEVYWVHVEAPEINCWQRF